MNISDLRYIKNRLILIRKINKLRVDNAGVDNEGTPFIKLVNGPVFFGLPSVAQMRKYYKLLPGKLQKMIPFECFTLANDIVIRYFEGGLKYGGPAKELYYNTKNGDVVAEMGSFLGHYTIYLSEKVGKNGRVIAIEPMSENIKILKKNICANNLKNVTIVSKGVWHHKDELHFSQRDEDNQSGSIMLDYKGGKTYNIPVDCLDNILRENDVKHVDFMLIQLNGVETNALNGLQNYKPTHLAIAARYNKDREDAPTIIKNILENRNYEVFMVKNKFVFASLKSLKDKSFE